MAPSSVLQKIAREMLATEGVGAIWRLHLDAGTLHRIGNPISASVFLEIADVAAEEWQRREAAVEQPHLVNQPLRKINR